jgi:hypothetical protein
MYRKDLSMLDFFKELSLQDWLGIFNLIVLTVTLGFIIRYVIDTNRIAKAAQSQVDITQRSLDLASSLAQPLFTEFGAIISRDETTVSFTNKGGTAMRISVVPKGDFSASISQDVIDNNARGKIRLFGYPQPFPEKLPFEIHYESKIGTKGSKKLYISASTARIEEDV